MKRLLLLSLVCNLSLPFHTTLFAEDYDDDQDQETTINEPGNAGELRNPELMQRFIGSDKETIPALEHFSFNVLGGLFHGALIGGIGGLAMYSSTDSNQTTQGMALIGGSIALTGFIGGIIVTIEERSSNRYYTAGPSLLEYAWFGTLAGAITGSLAGAVPYSSSNNTDDIINFTGYGAVLGFTTGMIWSLFDLPDSLGYNFTFIHSPEKMGISINQRF